MASGVNIFCFTACYFAAWMLELAGLTARYGWHRLVMLAFAGAGSAAQLWYLIERARQAPAAPLATTFDWCLLAAWVLAIIYLGLVFYSPGASIGLFLLGRTEQAIVLTGIAVVGFVTIWKTTLRDL